MRGCTLPLTLRDLHVLEFARLVVDTNLERRDPRGELARLELRLHQAFDEVLVLLVRQEVAAVACPVGVAHLLAVDVRIDLRELADVAVERDVRQLDLERDAEALDHLVPAADADWAS